MERKKVISELIKRLEISDKQLSFLGNLFEQGGCSLMFGFNAEHPDCNVQVGITDEYLNEEEFRDYLSRNKIVPDRIGERNSARWYEKDGVYVEIAGIPF